MEPPVLREWHARLERLIEITTHPASLLACSVISFVLWMPYGLGYFDSPWDCLICDFGLAAFVGLYAYSSLYSLSICDTRRRPLLRGVFDCVHVFVSLHGVLHMTVWWLRNI